MRFELYSLDFELLHVICSCHTYNTKHTYKYCGLKQLHPRHHLIFGYFESIWLWSFFENYFTFYQLSIKYNFEIHMIKTAEVWLQWLCISKSYNSISTHLIIRLGPLIFNQSQAQHESPSCQTRPTPSSKRPDVRWKLTDRNHRVVRSISLEFKLITFQNVNVRKVIIK